MKNNFWDNNLSYTWEFYIVYSFRVPFQRIVILCVEETRYKWHQFDYQKYLIKLISD